MQARDGRGGAVQLRGGVLMRGMFFLYLAVIATGLAFYIVIGLLGR